MNNLYPETAAALYPPLQPRDPRFVHGPAELCQLAGTWNGQPLPPGDWAIEEKVDGIRMLWIGDDLDGGEIVTRKGEPFDCAEHLRPELERLQRRFGHAMMFDGEYYEEGGFLPTLAAYRRGVGAGRFIWFDAMPVSSWRAGGSPRPLGERQSLMSLAIEEWTPSGIETPTGRLFQHGEDIMKLAGWMWDQGKEGLVLKDRTAPYVRGRRPTWFKVKREMELQAVLVEVLADGAAARVEYQGRKLRVAVPPPLRGRFAAGQTVTVKAMEWTETGQLRQGRIVGEAKC